MWSGGKLDIADELGACRQWTFYSSGHSTIQNSAHFSKDPAEKALQGNNPASLND